MELCPLAKVQHKISLGQPLPFSIRDGSSKLLLAKNQVVADDEQLEALLERGAFVSLDELRGARAEIYNAPPADLPTLWRKLADGVSRVLTSMPSPSAPQALDDAARYLGALTDRAPDIALYLMVRPDYNEHTRHSVMRSLQAATAGWLLAGRLGWPTERALSLVKAAFTMNLGMLDLHERLSHQTKPLSTAQRHGLLAHPMTSVKTLQDSGVDDAEWLEAVALHHEKPAGGGYPGGQPNRSEMAQALRLVDIFTAKLAARSTRPGLPAGRAIRELLTSEPPSALALALLKEVGPWPPGSLVSLQSGDTAVVVQRGADAQSPRVAVLANRQGEPLRDPVQRDALGKDHAIAGPADPARLRTRPMPERLFAKLHC